ncbi:PREDICTED: chymotrypsin-2-like [Ceratosolen solmsi marchali]|uniref:Chymotrypsin-2-like n=1 Tax=Ceratosolen solmsi marchali TaxID=326594 RepID=A0AAJ6YAZ0_9HYME|nr:PREDICTED: chymotrypsin-2-like [Ceratosolen solmsi marchali]
MLPTAFKIMIGSNDLTRSIETFPLFLITYNDWASNQRIQREFQINDIAFVKIIGNIPNNVPTAMLGNAPNSVFYGMNVQVAGWGKLLNNTIPRKLHTVTLTVMTKDECENRIRDFSGITLNVHERQFCTFAEPYALLNQGDSGGPVLLFDNIIGVNYGLIPDIDNNTHPEQVNIHLTTRYYLPFIRGVMVPVNF